MGFFRGFDGVREQQKNLSFFKIFQGVDLSSESMRAFPYDFVSRVPQQDFSNKMLIRTQWGSSWEVDVARNPRFYYMEKHGWDQFVRDNALGEDEFVTFTHKGKMCFNVSIYEQNGKEMIRPRELKKKNSTCQVKKEAGENSDKDEETGESPGGVKLKVRKKKSEECNGSKKKIKSEKKYVPEFTITIKKSYLKFLAVPSHFVRAVPSHFVNQITNKAKIFKIHHSNGKKSWNVHCLIKGNQVFLSRGWTTIAREFPLLRDDICTFKLIKPTEFLLLVSRKAKVD